MCLRRWRSIPSSQEYAKLYGIPDRAGKVDEVLDMMELSERSGDLVKTYSGGMRRRLELAQALVHDGLASSKGSFRAVRSQYLPGMMSRHGVQR
jgi:ABC-type taurine transport system ATPase subunit